MLLVANPALQPRVGGGHRYAGIAHLDHQVHLGQVGAESFLRLSDVAWVPLNRWSVDAEWKRLGHQGTTSTGQGASWITRAAVLC